MYTVTNIVETAQNSDPSLRLKRQWLSSEEAKGNSRCRFYGSEIHVLQYVDKSSYLKLNPITTKQPIKTILVKLNLFYSIIVEKSV